MKKCDQWVKHILEERDRQMEIRRKRRETAVRYSALAACFCVTVILGSQVFRRLETVPKDSFIKEPPKYTQTSDMPESTCETTIKAPESQASDNKITSGQNSLKITVTDNTRITSAVSVTGTVNDIRTSARTTAPYAGQGTAHKTSSSSVNNKPLHTAVSGINTEVISKPFHSSDTVIIYTSKRPSSTAATTVKDIFSKTTAFSEEISTIPAVFTTKIIFTSISGAVGTNPEIITEPTDFKPVTTTEIPVLNDKIIAEQFGKVYFNGMAYCLTDHKIDSSEIGEKMFNLEAQGNKGTATAEVYKINGIHYTKAVALWFDKVKKYYVYVNYDSSE